MINKLFLLISSLLFIQCSYAQYPFNGDCEKIDPVTKRPVGWAYSFSFEKNQEKAYPVSMDSVVKQSGKYSLRMEKAGNETTYGVTDYLIANTFKGYKIQLRGYMKTENVSGGYAGIWMRLDGADRTIALENMSDDGVVGTTDWKQYTIDMPYQSEVTAIHIGGLIVGGGKAWFDTFEILIDGIPIEKAELLPVKTTPIDTAFSKGSRIASINITPQQVVNLTATGQFWGFLKYHHTAVTKGNYNWDAELFRLLPNVIAAKNNAELSTALEKYLDQLPVPPACKNCEFKENKKNHLKPDYGNLLNGAIFSPSLTKKLSNVLANNNTKGSFYVSAYEYVGNPKFTNENAYSAMKYPDAGYRLLCLYRYWAMINYFFPYKNLIDENWNKVLSDFVPIFLNAQNEQEYTLAALRLIAIVGDTHANIWSGGTTLNRIKGGYAAPFQAKFIEGKLLVTGFYIDTLDIRNKLHIGDEIVAIDGKGVQELVKKYLPITPASNYDTQLRDLPREFLLRSNGATISFQVKRNGNQFEYIAKLFPFALAYKQIDYTKNISHYLINDHIGYVYPGKYKNSELPAIKKEFEHTKGIVVDMRCYPSEFMPFTFGNYIKAQKSPFVKYTQADLAHPGLFSFTTTVKNGGPTGNNYQGKVVVIVNSTSQSQAEYTTMAFQSSRNVKVIGSQTAAADGNVSSIVLPGGIVTMISGLGIFYPDGTPTQKVGVKIDYQIKPTAKGITEGKDELLEKAIELINKGW